MRARSREGAGHALDVGQRLEAGHNLSIACSLAALAMGAVVWKTTSAVSPYLDGNRSCRILVACCDGVFPAVNLFSKCVPTSCATTVKAMMARIHNDQHGPAAVVTGAGQAPQGVRARARARARARRRGPDRPYSPYAPTLPLGFITGEL